MITISGLLNGIVVETDIGSFTGKYLYSDYIQGPKYGHRVGVKQEYYNKDSALNKLAKIPVLGVAAGVARIALGIIHAIGHLIAALITLQNGHLYHACKGLCEILRGSIESIPVIGNLFAIKYHDIPSCQCGCCSPCYSWWMIKIYNPQIPDDLDKYISDWEKCPDTQDSNSTEWKWEAWPSEDFLKKYYIKA